MLKIESYQTFLFRLVWNSTVLEILTSPWKPFSTVTLNSFLEVSIFSVLQSTPVSVFFLQPLFFLLQTTNPTSNFAVSWEYVRRNLSINSGPSALQPVRYLALPPTILRHVARRQTGNIEHELRAKRLIIIIIKKKGKVKKRSLFSDNANGGRFDEKHWQI